MDELEKRVEHGADLGRPPSIAPLAQDTLDALKDDNRRPLVPPDPIPEDVLRSERSSWT